MNNPIRQLDIEELSDAMESNWWNKNEFMIFEGPIPQPKFFTPVRQNYYPFFLLETGHVEDTIDLQKYELNKNDLLFLKPSTILQVHHISEDAVGKVVAFEKSFLDIENRHLIEKLSFLQLAPPVISLDDNEAKIIGEIMSEMKMKLEDPNRPNRRQIAFNLISIMLLEIDAIYKLKHIQVVKKLSNKEIINRHFHSLLSAHYLRERSVAFYADQLSITPRYLSEVIKEITGKTAGELIDDMVVLESKVLLKSSELSIKQITEELNFSDQFTFSKYFKNSTGVSPSQYRNHD